MKETKVSYLDNRMLIEEKSYIFDLIYNNILYITYQDYYTLVFVDKRNEVYICQSLKKIMANLPPDVFFMCNKKTIINLSHVILIGNNGQYFLQLDCNDIQINISRRNVTKIKKGFLSLKKSIDERI
ncbi:MAG: LytTR family transcriptional regulator [Bacteroidales bacterium]|nr:LytTR family transcriptional regulator [Bacteroidales bacterium]